MSNNQVIANTVLEIEEVDASQVSGKGSSFGQQSAEKKEAAIRLLFAANPIIVKVGKLFAIKDKAGVSYAQHLKDGKTLQFSKVKLSDGSIAELKAPVAISLENVPAWGCLSCNSAHGSNVGASSGDGVKVSALASNEFYYGVETKTLFTVSRTCFEVYVAGNGLHRQIQDRMPVKVEVKQPVKQEVKK